MLIDVDWGAGRATADVPATESAVWRAVACHIADCPCPGTVSAACALGSVKLKVRQRGTYTKGGVERPSVFVEVRSDTMRGLAPSDYPDTVLVCVNPESNNYKVYRMEQRGDGLHASYGRIGAKDGEFGSLRETKKPYEPKLYWVRYYEKLSKGYVDRSTAWLDAGDAAPRGDGGKAAPEDGPGALYRALLACSRQMVDASIAAGESSVTPAMAQGSRELLSDLATKADVDSFNATLAELMALAPRRVSRVADLMASSTSEFAGVLAREESLVSAMEAVVSGRCSGGFKGLGVRVMPATERQREQVLGKLPDDLRAKVARVWRTVPKGRKDAFESHLDAHGRPRVRQFWHGSRNENWLSIMASGLKLFPDARITGKMFGDGIYFAPSATKSWGYTSAHGSFWAGGDEDTAYMGLFACAYGEPLDVDSAGRHDQAELERAGKSCVHAHAGAALRNDEVVFYSEDAMLMNYLVEFAA